MQVKNKQLASREMEKSVRSISYPEHLKPRHSEVRRANHYPPCHPLLLLHNITCAETGSTRQAEARTMLFLFFFLLALEQAREFATEIERKEIIHANSASGGKSECRTITKEKGVFQQI